MKKNFLFVISAIFVFSSLFLAQSVNAQVDIDSNGGIGEKIFGGKIDLDIFNPTKLKGEAGFWSLAAFSIQVLSPVSFIVAFGAAGIGAMKMSQSQGDSGKMESAKKWFVNGVLGIAATIVVLLAVNLVTTILGVGNIFNMAENLSVCGNKPLYEVKKNGPDGANYECVNGSWSQV